ncbi:MAG TPA: symmetrical bis(5'-nucleosyl)-tetraphosphatase [Steroidobacteraceae bacterium]
MARYAIGDVQGCCDELRALLRAIKFSADRDELWFVGDLVNRGPKSLETLRLVRSLNDNARVVLGNHDLHLLAIAFGTRRAPRRGDTLDALLAAPDREVLLEWLLGRPLAVFDAQRNDLLVHAGLVPQWNIPQTLALAAEVEAAIAADAAALLDHMYGNRPDRWSEDLRGFERLRFAINALTRMRFCTPQGRIDLETKGGRRAAQPPYVPWFEIEERASRSSRIIFGHWSTLGFLDDHGVVALDTGCVWGGCLSAFNLDHAEPPIAVPCSGYQSPGGD